MDDTAPDFKWNFHRLGGIDQATLTTSDELVHLNELNPKLWLALSCPSSGLEFNGRTLALIDTDNDGRIRMPEVLKAVDWLTARLVNPADMVGAPEEMPLEGITTKTMEGLRLMDTAKSVLAGIGKPGATSVSYADVAAALETAERNIFNGDGIISARDEFGPEAAAFIADAIAVIGGVKDAGGAIGINAEIATAFEDTLKAVRTWRSSVDLAETPLGVNTAEAWKLTQELTEKINDYFLRSEMASFAPWTRSDTREGELPHITENGIMATSFLENLPLARIEPDRQLSLVSGVNPAWRGRLSRFTELIRPLLADSDTLTREDWKNIQKTFIPYTEALAKKPDVLRAVVSIPPTGAADQLSDERIAVYLDGNVLQAVLELIAKDAAAPSASTDIADLERMVLYHANLHRLLMNFVSFHDFYSLQQKAMFQSGELYIDGRICHLCLPVTDTEAHAKLAGMSQLCLVYCQCSRLKDDSEADKETMNIVGAITAGKSDMLVVGRNGVFVDSSGRDWDATVTKVIMNPISIREAIWDPYRRFARAVGEQIGKFAASKQDDVTKNIAEAAKDTTSGKPEKAFDIGRSMGIFAAIGLALGAIGTAVASIASALFSLAWWQLPLVFVGAFLLISCPSMVLAWLKLRKRTLGPLLEASGWAVNSQVPINLTMGKHLTDTAVLPPNSSRSLNDPLSVSSNLFFIAVLFVVVIAVSAGWVWHTWPEARLPFQLPTVK